MASTFVNTTALRCNGSLCPKCRKCLDWRFTGSNETWKWICNYKKWSDDDRKRWYHEVHREFEKSNDATCNYDSISRLDFLGSWMDINPHCDKNSLDSAEDILKDAMHNGIAPELTEDGREIAPSYIGVTHHVIGRPHICLCKVELTTTII